MEAESMSRSGRIWFFLLLSAFWLLATLISADSSQGF